MIKLLALDLDGTLLNSRGRISEENKQAIRQAEDKGVLVTIATGRRFRDARPVALEIGFNAPIVTHNGALLKFADSLKTVEFSLLASETVLEILRVGKETGGDALVSIDPHGQGTLLYDRVSDENLPLKKYIAWAKTLHGDDPSAADPVLLVFRNATLGNGNYVYRTVTSALSLTISSGSTRHGHSRRRRIRSIRGTR